ncbi:MAG: AAA family ATPase [Trebonia sp.]
MTVCFVTGTDTGVGKTVVTAALAVILRARRKNVAVVKPALWGSRTRPLVSTWASTRPARIR